MAVPGSPYAECVIKSFKHNGSVHRVWLENWLVPAEKLHPRHAKEEAWVLLNDHTVIVEGDGKEWISRVPAVSFFMPGRWYNVVALIEEKGIRYYCNLASPPYRYNNVLTYIDYDLDVSFMPDGTVVELDRDEFCRHKEELRYGEDVEARVEAALLELKEAIADRAFPFGEEEIYDYYEEWKKADRNRTETAERSGHP
ncbi:DUF402 domain-containing protein [Cohnella suwonensis]|uniref:DUF402 domain-containing protein n=1 Tax=Cohnella suwonensis TaxID=696072 RepID=A0ABW0M0S9_9BACL